jgi:hypothetical protein
MQKSGVPVNHFVQIVYNVHYGEGKENVSDSGAGAACQGGKPSGLWWREDRS